MVSAAEVCTEMFADAWTPLLAAAVAVMTAEAARAGAVNNPLDEIDPALADQITPVCDVFLTVAANCNLAPGAICAVSGLSAIDIWLCALDPTLSCSNCHP